METGVRENMLRKIGYCMMADGFLKVVGEFGFDAANKLNHEVIRSIGRTEIKLLMGEMKYGKLDTAEKLKDLFETAVELYLPEEHKYEFQIHDNHTVCGKVIIIYDHLQKGQTASGYICSGKTRCDAWLEACGVKGDSFPNRTAQDCNGQCTITYKVKWD